MIDVWSQQLRAFTFAGAAGGSATCGASETGSRIGPLPGAGNRPPQAVQTQKKPRG